ncbi:MAG: OmpW family outer membrane protein [Flavisolibacter sp.]
MKSMPKIFLFLVLPASMQLHAQSKPADRDLSAFTWEIGVPASNKYLDKVSYSGWRFEYRKGIKSNLSVGIAMSWNSFNEYVPTKTYMSANQTKAITSDMIRQVYSLPITLIAHYYANTNSKMVQPYFGIGLGAQYLQNNSYLNIYTFQETNWGFVARPEVGSLFTFSKNSPVKALLALGLNVSTNKNEFFDLKGWDYVSINVGIGVGVDKFY